MKPDEVVEILKREWGLETTRRTVLTYEKQKLTTPPYIETGKYKEYPATVVAEFIASWCLIHGDYGVKPSKVAEIRKKALQILYSYQDIWETELPGLAEVTNLQDFIQKGTSWVKPSDFFVFTWIVTRMSVIDKPELFKECLMDFIKTGNSYSIPRCNIQIEYRISENEVTSHCINTDTELVDGKGYINVRLVDVDGTYYSRSDVRICGVEDVQVGYQDIVNIKYIHPEDFALKRPVID